MTTKGTLYLIPCPISDETAPWEVLPAANRAVMDSLDYFIVENTRSARRFLAKAGIARPIDGLDRRLGCGRWSVRVGGEAAPVVGRICMDSCMIDITDVHGVAEGDEVLIFSPAAGNDPEAMARVLGTIPYEVMTSVSGRVKRIYLKE